MTPHRTAIAVACAAILAGCGQKIEGLNDLFKPAGGTSDVSESDAAKGIWIGATDTGYAAATAILENGEVWSLYTAGNVLYGALSGSLAVQGSTISGTGTEYNLMAHISNTGSLSGTVTAKSNLRITTASGVTINGAYHSEYEQAMPVSTIAGTYSGWGVGGASFTQSVPVTISATGAINAGPFESGGCSASGTILPRGAENSVFGVSLTFSGASCALGNNKITSGYAFLDSVSKPPRLYMLTLKGDRSETFMWTGTQ